MYLDDNLKKELVTILEKLISFKTINEENDKYPFGLENKKCLDYILQLGKRFNFNTKNLDNYCGYLEIGKGDKTIGIVCHTDIVPEGAGWNSNPYKLTQINNKLYGRGTVDDKGPLAACIIALKIISTMNVNLNKKIRLIVGCNEETGCKCMQYYKTKEKQFDYGFTPDGDFPLIQGEKGILQFELKHQTTNIIDIKGGTALNKIPGSAIIKVSGKSYNKEKLQNFIRQNGLNINISSNNNIDTIQIVGKEGHASTPEVGLNAISFLLTGLKKANFSDPFIDFYDKYINISYNGKNLELNLKDQYSKLTFNVGKITKTNSHIKVAVDIRFPVTFKSQEVISILKEKLSKEDINIDVIDKEEPIFFKSDNKLIISLLKAYQEISKDKKAKPLIIGGGTYAKTLNNCVAFGPCFETVENNIHSANEYINIEHLYTLVDYYVTAILNLLEI